MEDNKTSFSIVNHSSSSSAATIFKRLMASKSAALTRQAYANDLRDFADFLGIESTEQHPLTAIPDTAWQHLDTTHVAAYLEYLKQNVSDKTGRPYSTATISRRITAIRELLTEAAYLDLYSHQRLHYLKERLTPPEVTHQHHAGITPNEQIKLLEQAGKQPGLKGLRDYALFRLWLDTGLRRAELASLKVKDLIVKHGIPTIVVRQGKGNKVREIGIESYTAHVVKEWLLVSGQVDNENNPMFCQVRKFGQADEAVYQVVEPDKHLSGAALWKLVCWYRQQANIDSQISPHSFRVALVTDALNGEAPLQHVQAVGGWTTTQMITQIYDRNRYAEPVARYRKTNLPRKELVQFTSGDFMAPPN
ncbi:MAG: Tyrosine recombinase XerC [Anaerolineae bacterium]|nr:Tyrosine recombinase XerC [Anaerolineae bacterium]